MQVKFQDVQMRYNDKQNNVLDEINFEIPEGQLISILGPSGCGKSTTLMLISGLIFPSEGKIFFNGEEVTSKDAVQRKVGMVFQNYALYPHLTVLENIMFPLKMAKMSKHDRKARALELAQLVKIEDHINKKPAALSGGQQQRVAIARALAKKPSILLMDEPLSNLDARLRIEMRQEIRRIQLETGITTIFVTHDQAEALSISDKVMVLNSGQIQQYSDPVSLYAKPNNRFVAEFIGTPVVNMLEKDAYRTLWDKLPLNAENKAACQAIGVRAEDLFRIPEANKDQAIITGQVTMVEHIGKDITIHSTDGVSQFVVSNQDQAPQIGDQIYLDILPENILYFDTTGQAIEARAIDGPSAETLVQDPVQLVKVGDLQ
ncbi:multiple sugar transport system ATP-binding protein [Aerococcus sp. 150760007-1]|uniref:ABC transporter ATP-binding protein n=2 Tax=Aerococcus urinaeequi TaxID=51665 RepID=A0ABR5ZZI8_9LACT|nr:MULTISPECIES: ABC transporter ATP-binding protein [Lactobacillales]KAF3302454.1 ATP-binding cassette domain-containing protein [Carnobacterium sp. PL17RED31]KAF3304146.1 ATP-binding cassette domain-containing protein [Carnobacterium sp. PL17GRE32]MBA5747146.1 ABC transporter ATP-binding protein [Aerococcus urinaeequi]MBA5829938.1 ABC transporter ATP-binding protein [Aerococcus urinaeequi]MBA5860881.1 ABC transporter ATP-binding protein [Aerococcus urinaeequi]